MILWARDELIALTGYRQKCKVAQWLRENGIRFYLARDGWPRVLRDEVVATPRTLKKSEPDLTALKERQKNGKAAKVSKGLA